MTFLLPSGTNGLIIRIFSLPAPLNVFNYIFIVDSFLIPWNFSLHFLNNYSKIIFFQRAMFRTNRFMTKSFFDNTKLATENISICCFLSNPGPKFTPSSNRLDTDEKLIITYSVTKDVYIRPCISLIRHYMQIYTS